MMIWQRTQTLVSTLLLLATSGLAIAQDSPVLLNQNLKDLYLFTSTETDKDTDETVQYLEVVLTANSYAGELSSKQVIDGDFKYEIYIADEELNILRTFSFFFGGPSQYAIQVTGERDPFVGKVGEYLHGGWFTAFAGLRADPAYYDKDAFRTFVDSKCLPDVGLRCADGGDIDNYFANKNTLGMTLKLDISEIQSSEENESLYKVWAKAFKKVE